tara:strand:- start:133 stop:549 length:417 start_codon:yes stop_codon:yes gene_type:complete
MDKCFECGDAAQANHHVVPKVLGGTQTIPLCLKCHGKVHNKDLVTMRKLYNNFLQKNPLKAGSYFKGGRRPYGFDVVDKILLENVEEQLVIERMMKELKEGKKMTAIVRGLNKDGILSASGRPWHYQSARNVMQRDKV